MDLSLSGLTVGAAEISKFLEVVMINIVLSGDNAIVIGLAVAGLPPEQRNKGIFWGIVGATVLRLVFTAVAVQMLAVVGLVLIGGLLLLWVTWKMWRELRAAAAERDTDGDAGETAGTGKAAPKSTREAIVQILIADLSMSLDNVLAVAGAAREHPYILGFGLVLSIALTAAASKAIARLLERYHVLGYLGVLIIAYVGLEMVWDGGRQVLKALGMV